MDSHETKIFSAVLIATAIIAVILIYFIISIIRNHRRHLRLQHQNLVVEITTLENERRRIVTDLHDELGPLLSVVKMQVSSVDARDQEDIQLVNKARVNLDIILERIRGICNDLMPRVLDRKGLITAVNEFLTEIHYRTDIQVTFSNQCEFIPVEKQLHIYRMIQETVHNAVKHSQADRISIRLLPRDGKIILEIEDDGKGFIAEEEITNGSGLGLKNILSRTHVLRGDAYILSSPGTGTKFTIEIPNA